jgi:hypothetical protein
MSALPPENGHRGLAWVCPLRTLSKAPPYVSVAWKQRCRQFIIGNGQALPKEPVGLLLARTCVLFPKLNQKREIVSAVRLELFQLCFFAAPNLATSWKVPVSPGGARFMSEPRVRSGYQCPDPTDCN